jgi:hypothetical protein
VLVHRIGAVGQPGIDGPPCQYDLRHLPPTI